MAVNWGDIYEIIYICEADTIVANAFRRAVGLPMKSKRGGMPVKNRRSVYADVDFEELMGQRYGVRM
mgnify:CR=1 FL=1